MFSEHVDIAEQIRQVFIELIDDERKICSLEVNVLDLKTFEILLMDRQAIIGVDEAERIAAGDEEVVGDLLVDLCRTVHTPLYDRRNVLIRTRQHLYGILEEAGLHQEFRREFLQAYEERFQEEERTDDRSRMLEVALEVDWLKSKIAEELARLREDSDPSLSEAAEESDGGVTVEMSGRQITIDIPETSDPVAEESEAGPEAADDSHTGAEADASVDAGGADKEGDREADPDTGAEKTAATPRAEKT